MDFKLSSTSGETLTLYDSDLTTPLDTITFGPQTLNTSQGRLPDGGTNIILFRVNEATPAESNFLSVTNLMVNEVLTHTDPPLEDAVELFNPTTDSVDISNWWLSNNRNDPMRYRIPPGTVIPPGGFKVFYEYQFNANGLGFTFNSYEPGEVVLFSGDTNGFLTGDRLMQRFGPARNGVSFGRYQTSRGVDFVAMSERTFGMDTPEMLSQFRAGSGHANAYPLIGPVIINELMYHPPDATVGGIAEDNIEDEYLELYNTAGTSTPLYDPLYPTNQWRIRNGVSFDFPPNLSMPARSYLLVVSFSPTNTPVLGAFRAKYHLSTNTTIVGPYRGKLDNWGETIELLRLDPPQAPDRPKPGLVPYVLVDQLAYEDRSPWPYSPDGNGNSLQRRSAIVYGNDPVHWLGAPPTPAAPNSIEPPVIESAARGSEDQIHLRFKALPGVAYTVEWQTNLAWSNPITLTNIAATTEPHELKVYDYARGASAGGRFYRLRLAEQP